MQCAADQAWLFESAQVVAGGSGEFQIVLLADFSSWTVGLCDKALCSAPQRSRCTRAGKPTLARQASVYGVHLFHALPYQYNSEM